MRREFFHAAGARLFSVTAGLVAGLLNLKLYGRFFTPDVYGVIVVALQLISYLPLVDGGFRSATNRKLLATEEEAERQNLVLFSQVIYSWILILILPIGGLLLGAYDLLAAASSTFGPLIFVALGIMGAFSVFANAQAGLLIGLGAQASMAFIAGLSSLVAVASLAATLYLGGGAWAFVASLGASTLATYTLARYRLASFQAEIPWLQFRASPKFWDHFHALRGDAWRAFRSQVSILLLFSSDLVLVAIFCSPADTAVYGVLSRLHSILRGFLQAFNEAAWPIVARRAEGMEVFQKWLMRTNGWIYGLAGGGLLITTPYFINWYMGSAWVPSPVLNALFVARFLIIGSSTPASYFLLGIGDFRNLARCCEREVVFALLLGCILGAIQGNSAGVALGYLLATSAGTLLPLWLIYARNRGLPLLPLLFQSWLRITLGFLLASIASHYAAQLLHL